MAPAEIGKKVGKVLHHYHMAKHCTVQIEDKQLSYARRAETIQREAALDGLYVIRTSEPAERLSA